MSKIFFTSDLHFSYKNIAKFCPQFRRFASVEEMDEHLVAMWNRTVSPEDEVYNLGDLSFSHDLKHITHLLSRLNGRHHLIFGNHDDLIQRHISRFFQTTKADGHPLLASAQPYLKLKLPEINNTLILFHYPINEWDGCHKGWYHLYGHLHDRLAPLSGRALNVGFDLHGRFLSPQDIDTLLRPLPAVSHFGEAEPMPDTPDTASIWVEQKLAEFNPRAAE
ncbi:metallophosphoesterase [Eikenella corrodens]|uniref:metallophosphoesterase n=1 Tax=Eikenella corrodens TaxID=539 RepID=UPI000B4C878B|nr:metallophosphoesterase [Eikenella corrodens]OWP26782.1 phosphoesterase [Eikenella corrodens]